MEQTRKEIFRDFNPTFFIWCLALPVFVFIITLSLANSGSSIEPVASLNGNKIRQFLNYYETYLVDEFVEIFFNNYAVLLVIVYFTPIVLGLRRVWEKWRGKELTLSSLEKSLLYLFPGIFLARQAVNIAITVNALSVQINKNVVITLAGIILPHGLPELLAFSLAGAIGMEVTRKMLSTASGTLVNMQVMCLLCIFTALCAFLEVSFTPRVFALLMAATGTL